MQLVHSTMSSIKEATFRHQFLTTDKAEILLAQLNNLQALNLSQNKLDSLPRGIPSCLIALDLSFNLFSTFPSSDRISNLIELKLSNNNIERWVFEFRPERYLSIQQRSSTYENTIQIAKRRSTQTANQIPLILCTQHCWSLKRHCSSLSWSFLQ